MNGVLSAERTIFAQLDTIGRVFLVLLRVVVALFTFGTSKSDSCTRFFRCHNETPSKKLHLAPEMLFYYIIYKKHCQLIFAKFYLLNNLNKTIFIIYYNIWIFARPLFGLNVPFQLRSNQKIRSEKCGVAICHAV